MARETITPVLSTMRADTVPGLPVLAQLIDFSSYFRSEALPFSPWPAATVKKTDGSSLWFSVESRE